MGVVLNDQSFHLSSDGTLLPSLVNKFKISMDTVLRGGRNITIHLPPIKMSCGGGCKFNSSYKKFTSPTGGLCTACRGEGFKLEQRQTIYKANIRQMKNPIEDIEVGGQQTTAGKLSQKIVRTKTVIAAFDHISGSIGATIDGEQYKLWAEPEKIGFGGTLLYCVARWKKMDK